MLAIVTLFIVVLLSLLVTSLLVTRVAAVALTLTGMSREAAIERLHAADGPVPIGDAKHAEAVEERARRTLEEERAVADAVLAGRDAPEREGGQEDGLEGGAPAPRPGPGAPPDRWVCPGGTGA